MPFDDLLALGLPRGDQLAELAMLYRLDCAPAFLRMSSFHLDVLRSANLPVEVALAVLATNPSAYEIKILSARADIPAEILSEAARTGYARGRNGRQRGSYLELAVMPTEVLVEAANEIDVEAARALGHPACPEEVVERFLLSRSARVRYQALKAVGDRRLAIDSALIRAARDLPMSERRNTNNPYAGRARALAKQILENR